MPWRGPTELRPFPTLGDQVGQWIEAHLVVGDGYLKGQPYRLTDEMWRFLFRNYQLVPDAAPWPSDFTFQHTGAQLRRSQKWGKDPFGAAIGWAEALGPTRFDGWDAHGDPVGAPYPTPLIACLGTSEEQTANTYRPFMAMAQEGPLINTPNLDVGITRTVLPGGGQVDPVTCSMKARLGAPMTMAIITETHLFTLQGGYRGVAGAVKRNVTGMDGRWIELTNGWDPTEASEAQNTAESGDPSVYVDSVESIRVENLEDDEELYAELLRQYGDSAREKGGWVNVRGRIMPACRSKIHIESDRRRYFLNEIVVGMSAFVQPERWDAQARDDDPLQPGDVIALGFDGSKKRDATALIAERLRDRRLFPIKIWERPKDAGPDWQIPGLEVDRAVKDVFEAYQVTVMFADPYRYQDYLDAWSAKWPDKIVMFPTNVEIRMDRAIERFMTSLGNAEITHDGDAQFKRHMLNAVVTKGSRKKPRPGDEELQTYYLKLAKKSDGRWIDGAVGGVLAHEAGAYSIEHGLQPKKRPRPMVVFR
jgi:hypothetical protein